MAPLSAILTNLRWWWLAALAAACLHVAVARWHVRHGAPNADEGFYAIAARAVAAGEMPYRDFGFTQPPVVAYANALPLQLAGFGIFPQRTVNGCWGAAALLLAAWCLGRATHPGWGVGLAVLFSLTAPWMYFIHLGKTYAVTAFLAMLAAWVYLALPSGPRRHFLLGFLGVLGVGARLPAAPYFGLLWLIAVGPALRRPGRDLIAGLGGALTGLAVAVLPFAVAAPEAFWFWTVDFHRLSVPNKPWSVAWAEIVTLAPAAWLLALLAIGVLAWRRVAFSREGGLLVAAGVGLAANLLPRGAYGEYGVPLLLPFALAAGLLAIRARPPAWAAVVAGAVLVTAQALVPPALVNRTAPERRGTLSQWLPTSVPPYQPNLPADLAAARQIVAQALPPTAPFVGTNLILAAETGHRVPAVLRMGPFSWTDEMPPERAARLHLATRSQLDAWFADPSVTVLAFFRRWDLNYGWSMPSFQTETPAARAATLDRLERDFFLAYNHDDFFVLVRRHRPYRS